MSKRHKKKHSRHKHNKKPDRQRALLELPAVIPAAPAVEQPAVLPASAPSLRLQARGAKVREFLKGVSIALATGMVRRFKGLAYRKLLTPFNIAAAAVTAVMIALFILLFLSAQARRTSDLSAERLRKKAEHLRAELALRVRLSVPLDTTVLDVRYPAHHAVLSRRAVEVFGTGRDSMMLLLIVNGGLRDYARVKKGNFAFRLADLKPGENIIIVKGMDASQKYYEKRIAVTVDEKAEARAERKFDYARPQPFTAGAYDNSLNFSRGDEKLRKVALTFDGSGHAGETDRILDTLGSRGVRVTLFLTGEFLGKHPDLARKIAEQGHVLGNHLESHPHLTTWEQNSVHETLPGVTREYLLDQLKKVEERYARLGIMTPRIWRAPYGEQNRLINSWAESAGYRHIGWTAGGTWLTNLDTNDWVAAPGDRGYFTTDEILKKILNFGSGTPYGLNGGIILMHIGTLRKQDPMYTKLGVLIDSLKSRGYELVTVPEMMAAPVN